MSFIDWWDSEGMLGLLVDFVADEKAECLDDLNRRRFLGDLLNDLRSLETELPEVAPSEAILRLREIHESAEREFSGDPVMVHLKDCIEELERIDGDGAV